MEMLKSNWNGSMNWKMLAKIAPAKPENDAPIANASSFVCTRLIPMLAAATSSSRMATQARPSIRCDAVPLARAMISTPRTSAATALERSCTSVGRASNPVSDQAMAAAPTRPGRAKPAGRLRVASIRVSGMVC